ncbi:hypothetical protein M406DRAFT_334458 [Cryphonectria parasitica EP155]|uniref:Secreted protein n=1 Tax=Cryphonectria parasitica (strain ATCC 38755 / EP155) TaxID=660469 RepID=A0A9P4XTY9_CRYP1|nr:uncharacterized protein M406DRAFT_334458 [Cryphonectria parasitica EP155]KAF3760838.1 hypothetical protein M406DRAFT_334458 [Cryphonectria parasitica EP155]
MLHTLWSFFFFFFFLLLLIWGGWAEKSSPWGCPPSPFLGRELQHALVERVTRSVQPSRLVTAIGVSTAHDMGVYSLFALSKCYGQMYAHEVNASAAALRWGVTCCCIYLIIGVNRQFGRQNGSPVQPASRLSSRCRRGVGWWGFAKSATPLMQAISLSDTMRHQARKPRGQVDRTWRLLSVEA